MTQTSDAISRTLAERCVQLSAGCDVDCGAVERWLLDLPTLRRLAEGYRAGWLHNVMGRITPLTLRKKNDYLAMADIFIDTEEAAERLLDKFQTDIELFCQLAGITVTEHMTEETASDELKAHVGLYREIAALLCNKYHLAYEDPIQAIATAPLEGMCNPFISEFMDERFPERAKEQG
ncbi:MAG: hypothetical protein OXR68_06320 [Alphaproteobacteria bacterium]|nr:hypothetical protein [Alphaproteobacteria bacterium]MDD9920220.1 hypothetical protein [Alphaproteobacteria bacterium]